MSANSNIEWTDASWNPTRGCDKISPGCKHCYAEVFAERFRGVPGHAYEQGFDLRLVPESLSAPLHWRKPRRIFVNSMSDLFHVGIPDDYLDRVFGVMHACEYSGNAKGDTWPGHVFQVLTKRAERMRAYLSMDRREEWARAAVHLAGGQNPDGLHDQIRYREVLHPRIHLGVSVENADYKHRITDLQRTPAALRFISFEPLLGDVGELDLDGIGWIITGAESGHGARKPPGFLDAVRRIRDQAVARGVPFFYKQDATPAGGKLPLPVLDGRTWEEFPAEASS